MALRVEPDGQLGVTFSGHYGAFLDVGWLRSERSSNLSTAKKVLIVVAIIVAIFLLIWLLQGAIDDPEEAALVMFRIT